MARILSEYSKSVHPDRLALQATPDEARRPDPHARRNAVRHAFPATHAPLVLDEVRGQVLDPAEASDAPPAADDDTAAMVELIGPVNLEKLDKSTAELRAYIGRVERGEGHWPCPNGVNVRDTHEGKLAAARRLLKLDERVREAQVRRAAKASGTPAEVPEAAPPTLDPAHAGGLVGAVADAMAGQLNDDGRNEIAGYDELAAAVRRACPGIVLSLTVMWRRSYDAAGRVVPGRRQTVHVAGHDGRGWCGYADSLDFEPDDRAVEKAFAALAGKWAAAKFKAAGGTAVAP